MPTDKLKLGDYHTTTFLKETTNIVMIDRRDLKGKKGTREISVMRDMRGTIDTRGRDTIGMKEMIEGIEKEKEIEIGKEVIETTEVIVEIGEIGTKEVIATREVIDKDIIETNTENRAARTGKKIALTHPKITEAVHRKHHPILATAHTSHTVTHFSH